MPRQRWIHPELWTDPSLGQLTPTERLFFIGCFSNADDEGRLLGNAAFLRSIIFPYDDISVGEIEAIRERVTTVCSNLVYYQVEGIEYLAFLKWSDYQKPKYPKLSKLPAPPYGRHGESLGEDFSNDSESLPENSAMGRVGKDRVGIRLGREGLGGGDQAPPDSENRSDPTNELGGRTSYEQTALDELQKVPGYPFDPDKDLEFIRELTKDFPNVDPVTEVKRWRTYKKDKPLQPKSKPRLQLRNWFEIAAKDAKPRGRADPNRDRTKERELIRQLYET